MNTKKHQQDHLTRRPRRLRQSDSIRQLIRETRLHASDFIQTLFIIDGNGNPEPVPSMPGMERLPIQHLLKTCETVSELGIPGIKLFPFVDPALKDTEATEATNPDNLLCRAVSEVKKHFPELTVMTDVALDLYTPHCHDGLLNAQGTDVDNDTSLEVLAQMALNHASAGADFVGPSDMMDGRVATIRQALDSQSFTNTGIIAYTAKYNSAFYGPYREAVGTAPSAKQGTLSKLTYQMHPAQRQEALVEAQLDTQEGADILMVKPAGAYLDIISDLSQNSKLPTAAFQISGEYATLHAAAAAGILDLDRAREESLLAIKRAGADIILSYFSIEQAKALNASS